MRILVVTTMYPPQHYGGLEQMCHDVVRRWSARGHEVEVLTSDLLVVPGAPERHGGVHRDLRLYWDDHRLLTPSWPQRFRRERANQAALARALASSRPDVVSVWGVGTLSMGVLRTLARGEVPMVFVVCDEWARYAADVDPWTRAWRNRRRLARAVERVTGLPAVFEDVTLGSVACFTSADTLAASRRSPFSFPDATITYSGIDTDDFPIGARTPRPTWDGRLLCVGRIDRRKGLDIAVRALALLDDQTTLDIVGRGDDEHLHELHDLVAELGLTERVRFSLAERADLAAIYAAADAFVFPVRWNEPFGLTPLEAMACATPVIATATGGSAEFLADGHNCLRIPVEHPEALADAVRRLAADPELRTRLAAAGLRTAAGLTTDHVADRLEAWHTAAAERFAHGRPPERPPVEVGS